MQANNILANVAKRRTSHPDAAPRRSMRRELTAAVAGAVIAASMLAQPAASLAAPERAAISLAPIVASVQAAPAASQYFAQTGITVNGDFLGAFRRFGLDTVGYPISQELTEDGVKVQYFERVRMEYHPELALNGKAVQLTRLGSLMYERRHKSTSQVLPASAPAPAPAPASQVQAQAAPAAPSHQMSAAETAIVDEINRLRREAGLAPVQPAGDLANLSRARSVDMATRNYFNHTTPEGRNFLSMLKERGIGYKFAGEILAKNTYPDDAAAGTAIVTWLNSPAHKAIMYDGRFTQAGAGYAKAADGTHYFTVVFVQK
jgi:uncharacterized protein YkwD